MKLTEKIEAEVLKVYNSYWDGYLKGDVKKMASLLAGEYKQVGSAESEVFFNKKDAVKFLSDTIDQVAGKLQMRNRSTKLEQQDKLMLVHELCDVYVLADNEWVFYSKFRASTLMQKKKEKWKIIHQHTSFPDTRTGDGINIAIEKIAEENLQLREAVKRRTIELEQKNRELEIETSLERVRAVAMGMKKPDDILGICKVMFTELQSLGFADLRNTLINFWDDAHDSLIDYDYSDYAGSNKALLSYSSHPVFEQFQKKIKNSKDAFAKLVVKKDQLESWKQRRRESGEYEDPRLNNISALYYYFYSIGVGAIGISTFSSLPADQLNLLKRFRNVFDFAYRRYADVAQAEAQAQEAKIEASLERMRAVAMGLRKSEEVISVCESMYNELTLLGFTNIRNTQIAIKNDPIDSYSISAYSRYEVVVMGEAPYKSSPLVTEIYDELGKSSNRLYQKEFSGKKFEDWRKWRESLAPFKDIRETTATSMCFYLYSFSNGHVGISTYNAITNEQVEIIKRFKNVFELSYQRYTDVANAEAQAREAQVELALERVRARTMAMQHSNELAETAAVLFEQFYALGEMPERMAIEIVNEEEHVFDIWATEDGGKQMNFLIKASLDEPHVMQKMYKAWKEQLKSITIDLQGKELEEYFQFLMDGGLPVKREIFGERRVQNVATFSKGILTIITPQPRPQETIQLLERFAAVFDGTYTRFLDLQKAEAQAREAQIEAALERVRSRTMGMQKSEELKEVIQVVYEQFVHLNINIEHTGFVIDYKARDDYDIWIADPLGVPSQITVPYFDSVYYNRFNEAKEKGEDFFATHLTFEEKNKFYEKLFEYVPGLPEEAKAFYFSCPSLAASTVLLEDVCLYIENFSGIPYTDEENNTLMRFGKVFQQTYTRFHDLQKAEAQAREAEIELSLERVRSKAMAMHGSGDVLATTTTAFEELKKLGIHSIRCGIGLLSKNSMEAQVYASATDSNGVIQTLVGARDMNDHPSLIRQYQSWLKQENLVDAMSGEELKLYYNKLFFQSLAIPATPQNFDNKQYGYYFSFADGMFYSWANEPYTENEINILNRFKAIVALTFRRFLDLQKAEAQAREAKIEVAMERTRTQSMIMQHSKELDDTLRVFHEQVLLLGIPSAFSYLWLPDEEKEQHIFWAAWAENVATTQLVDHKSIVFKSKAINYPLDRNEPATAQCLIDWKSNESIFSYHVPPSGVENYFAAWQELLAGVEQLKPEYFRDGLSYVEAFMKYGCFGVLVTTDLSEDEKKILGRFAIEFERTYRRFLDLQKAEAQAREAQIETALEKVRSRTMGMRQSDELGDVATVLFKELNQLVDNLWSCGFVLCEKERGEDEWWLSTGDGFIPAFYLPNTGDATHANIYDVWKNGEIYHTEQLEGEALQQHYDWLMSIPVSKNIFDDMKAAGNALPAWQKLHCAYFSYGYLVMITQVPCPEEQIFKRFAQVFDQTYTRFLDLQKAEAQAREAMIEAAMEKVRGRAMAMQKPEELVEVAQVLRQEMGLLGVEELETSSIYIHDEVTGTTECWYAIQDVRSPDKKLVTDHMTINLNDTWVGREMLKFYNSDQKQASILMEGENRKEWINDCAQHSKMIQGYYGDVIPERTYHLIKFSNGFMGAASPGEISGESWELLKRTTTVFSMAYTRFSDLLLAEGNAKEAKKQSALDRVRAEIASMRTKNDLERITPLIWNELITLGVSFIRCGVFIMDDSHELIHTFLSTPDGKAIAAFHLPYDTQGNIQLVLSHWQSKKNYIDHWDEAAFAQFAGILVQQGDLASAEQYQKTIPGGGFYLHFLPFLQGMLYVGNTTQLGGEEINLIQSVADAFSTAYARYEDFNKLEEAKVTVERTLTDLKSAQSQLIQSEKMASLGELTAGIAHEIQNPLNFVNNFSEVNTELIEEMKEEIDNGNLVDAKAIANDIADNEQKINHHGKRADAIVKGMLQHSRSSDSGSAVKEPTDINRLADEYLRLAYHGLRAKDNSFNATLNTDFDESIGNLNIVPQDIGRVILNLITNAFYAAPLPPERGFSDPDYKHNPTVWVSTKKVVNKVLIVVRDNGPGIPQKILDKIFQPFFTTKPTGQGTGLGLSLSYDIVKAHGGELKVETKEGEGTTFIVSLPV